MLMFLSIALLQGCSEYAYTSRIQKDVFQQERRNTVDILVVVDNSCSMQEEQEKLSSNFESFISAFVGVDVDWQIGIVTTDTYYAEIPGQLLGGDDEVILVDQEGRTLDAVHWDRSWAVETGASLQLDPSAFSPTSNTIQGNWCSSTTEFGFGDLGTPGAENNSCSSAPPLPLGDTGSSEETSEENSEENPEDTSEETSEENLQDDTPQVGDIVFTEIMMDPEAVADSLGEWVELYNLSDKELDLSSHRIEDAGKNSYEFPEGTKIGAGEFLVVGRSEEGGAEVQVVAEYGFTLNNSKQFITAADDDAAEIFEEMVVVGTSGSGIEMGLEAAHRALSEPLISSVNEGFLREEANLALIFLSDEDDFSPRSVHEYARLFTEIKGESAYRNKKQMNISAVVGKERPPFEGAPSCESSNGIGYYGPRYIELARRTEGILESICDEDFSPIAQELGLTASGLEVSFKLSSLPDLESLEVKVYAEESDDSLLGELERDVDYTYSVMDNALEFEVDSLPPSEAYIVAEYKMLPESASIEETEDTSIEQ